VAAHKQYQLSASSGWTDAVYVDARLEGVAFGRPPLPPGSSRMGGVINGGPHTPSWVYRGRLTGRLWNTTSCLTVAPLAHSLASTR
jgi:hypothetical protein